MEDLRGLFKNICHSTKALSQGNRRRVLYNQE